MTGDEAQWTMGRRAKSCEALSRPFPPSRLPLRANFYRERDVSVRGRSVAELRAETGPKKNHPGFFAISVKNGEFQANFYIPFERVGMLVKSVRVLRSELLKSCLEHFSKTAPVLHKSRSLSKLINFCLNFRT